MKLLIVEDEIRLADTLGQIMREQKYTVDLVYDGESGLDYALMESYDVIILDVMLPKINGFEVVKRLRQAKNATPVLLLTARDETRETGGYGLALAIAKSITSLHKGSIHLQSSPREGTSFQVIFSDVR